MVLHRPQEYILTYEPPQLYFDSSHVQKIREKLSGQKRFHSFLKKMNETLLHLGPWCCDKRCSTILSDLSQKASLDDLQGDLMVEEELEIKDALDICKDILTERNPDTSDRARFSPKVHRLITSLKCESQHQNFCAIIFVERRDTALALHELIESIDGLSHVKSDVMTGHGSTEEGDISMTYTRQNKIIQGFRENEINLMIATNVAEEGLDIQPCNYVYRLVFYLTEIYIYIYIYIDLVFI
jgi:endoribonuclease Dicer